MTTAFWCVLVAGLLPYAGTIAAKGGRRFDNNNPRAWLADQTGWRARANAAQLNGFEAFPLFAAAVVVAHLTGAAQARVDLLALLFVGANRLPCRVPCRPRVAAHRPVVCRYWQRRGHFRRRALIGSGCVAFWLGCR